MREQKKHWKRSDFKFGPWASSYAWCGRVETNYASAKKNVTCKNCLRAMGEKK